MMAVAAELEGAHAEGPAAPQALVVLVQVKQGRELVVLLIWNKTEL